MFGCDCVETARYCWFACFYVDDVVRLFMCKQVCSGMPRYVCNLRLLVQVVRLCFVCCLVLEREVTVVGGRRSWLYVLKVAVGGAVHSVQVRGTVVGGRGTKYKIDGWGPGPVGRSVGWLDGWMVDGWV